MLWPSLVVIACGAIFLRLEIRRRRLTLCGRRESVDGRTDPAAADLVLVTRPPTHGGAGTATSSTNIGVTSTNVGECIGRKLAAQRSQYNIIILER